MGTFIIDEEVEQKIEKYLKEKECEGFIHEKGYRANPLTNNKENQILSNPK